ncbi:hypothetical protein GCM10023201_56180 [Actinomycetospora corticicola]|uniref:4-amino-4-deoxy-L-arabinose transferase-like glycosyltransferase n=1 Tax=Actinomycetospora corticicola TaxID=663602 RepID=A0A7Y9DZP3_9PSEU|nr:hypothetical protein [Actinomycetospora corticicola]NYD38471.1 hypothetical protein [Actinomycetospora corticicola]
MSTETLPDESPTRADDGAAPSAAARAWRVSPDLPAALGGALAGVVLFLLAHRGMPDDTYITLDYARNLAEHAHWGLTPFRDSNSATSPLNVWLLAAGILVTGRPAVAVGLVLVLATTLLGLWAAGLAGRLGLRRPVLAALVVGLTVSSPVFASVVGMESFLGAALLLGVARYAADRRPVAAGVVLGFAVLCRPDLAVPGLVLLGALLAGRTPSAVRPLLPALAATVVVALPWHLFSWFALGGFVPDTLVIKTGGAFPNGEVFGNGPLFWAERWPVPMVLIGAVALTGLAATARSLVAVLRGRHTPVDRVVVACGAAGLLHYGVYAAMGVSSYIWYYCPSSFLLTVCAALLAADLAGRRAGAGVATALAVVAGMAVGIQVVGPLPWTQPVIFGNWATSAQYIDAGRALGAALPPGRSVAAPGEIGALAYGCRCDIVDVFSDHDRVRALAEERERAGGPLTRAFLGVNYLFSDTDAPRPTDQVLRWEAGTGPGWPTDVPGRGPGRLVLGP